MAHRLTARGGWWGRIANVSTDGSPGPAAEVSYGATKHALESLTHAAAIELGPFGIPANIVAPGPIQTGYLDAEAEADIARQTPLRRIGRPDDVTDVIAFLCSNEARWLTGQTLFVGGGWRMVYVHPPPRRPAGPIVACQRAVQRHGGRRVRGGRTRSGRIANSAPLTVGVRAECLT